MRDQRAYLLDAQNLNVTNSAVLEKSSEIILTQHKHSVTLKYELKCALRNAIVHQRVLAIPEFGMQHTWHT